MLSNETLDLQQIMISSAADPQVFCKETQRDRHTTSCRDEAPRYSKAFCVFAISTCAIAHGYMVLCCGSVSRPALLRGSRSGSLGYVVQYPVLVLLHDASVLFLLPQVFGKQGIDVVSRILAFSSLVMPILAYYGRSCAPQSLLVMHDMAVTACVMVLTCRRHCDDEIKIADEEAKKKTPAEEANNRVDVSSLNKADEEAKNNKADEEAEKEAAEEAKQKAEEEAKQKAAEEAKQKADEEAKQKKADDDSNRRPLMKRQNHSFFKDQRPKLMKLLMKKLKDP